MSRFVEATTKVIDTYDNSHPEQNTRNDVDVIMEGNCVQCAHPPYAGVAQPE